MIKTIKHKGLKKLFTEGKTVGVQPDHADKLLFLMSHLDDAEVVDDMALPGANLHPLKHDLKGHWAVKVSGNRRMTFKFEDGDAYVVDYQDYH